MKRRPVIGVTGPDRGGAAAWWFTRRAVRRAGGRALRITPSRPQPIERLDGLIIGGGADVGPALYGEEPVRLHELKNRERSLRRYLLSVLLFPLIYLIRRLTSIVLAPAGSDPARDVLESELIRQALERDLPLLGICRGAQLLNVICGGTLYQALDDFYVETPQIHTIWPYKPIEIVADSRLAAVMSCTECQVNSLHRQAINALAPGLRVAARESTGVVQAVEHLEKAFAIGVQWHPEYLPQRKEQHLIFERLITLTSINRP